MHRVRLAAFARSEIAIYDAQMGNTERESNMKSIKYKSLPEKTANVLSEYLYRENYQVGAKLPNELILAEQFEVSRNTIRKAIQM